MRFSYMSTALGALSIALAVPTPEGEQQGQSQPPSQEQTQKVIPPTYTGGEAIYYLQERQYGTCMEVHEDSDYVVAISYKLQGTYLPPPHCGREVEITNVGGGKDNHDVGKKIRAKVVDTCTVCDTADMEMSVGTFQALKGGELDPNGNFTIDWQFV